MRKGKKKENIAERKKPERRIKENSVEENWRSEYRPYRVRVGEEGFASSF